jgi:hypothetical protein
MALGLAAALTVGVAVAVVPPGALVNVAPQPVNTRERRRPQNEATCRRRWERNQATLTFNMALSFQVFLTHLPRWPGTTSDQRSYVSGPAVEKKTMETAFINLQDEESSARI